MWNHTDKNAARGDSGQAFTQQECTTITIGDDPDGPLRLVSKARPFIIVFARCCYFCCCVSCVLRLRCATGYSVAYDGATATLLGLAGCLCLLHTGHICLLCPGLHLEP